MIQAAAAVSASVFNATMATTTTTTATILSAVVEVGGYINAWKILPVLVVLLLWGRLLTWADKDTLVAHLPREALNLGMVVGLVLGFALFFFLPTYPIALSALIGVMLIEIGRASCRE